MRLLWILVTVAGFGTKTGQGRVISFPIEDIVEFRGIHRRPDINIVDSVPKSSPRAFINLLESSLPSLMSYPLRNLEDIVSVFSKKIGLNKQENNQIYKPSDEEINNYVSMNINDAMNARAQDMGKKISNLYEQVHEMKTERSVFLNLLKQLYNRLEHQKIINNITDTQTSKSKPKKAVSNISKEAQNGINNILYNLNLDPELRRYFKIRFESFWDPRSDPTKVDNKIDIHIISSSTTTEKPHILKQSIGKYMSEEVSGKSIAEDDTKKSSSYESGKTSTEEEGKLNAKDTISTTGQSMIKVTKAYVEEQITKKKKKTKKKKVNLPKETQVKATYQVKAHKQQNDSFLNAVWNELNPEKPKIPQRQRPDSKENITPPKILDNPVHQKISAVYRLSAGKHKHREKFKQMLKKHLKKSYAKRVEASRKTKRYATLIQEEIILTGKTKRKHLKLSTRPIGRTGTTRKTAKKVKKEKIRRHEDVTKSQHPRLLFYDIDLNWDGKNRIDSHKPIHNIIQMKRFEDTSHETHGKHKYFAKVNNKEQSNNPKSSTTADGSVSDYGESKQFRQQNKHIQQTNDESNDPLNSHSDTVSDEETTVEDLIEKSKKNIREDNPWQAVEKGESLATDKVVKRIDHLEKEVASPKNIYLFIVVPTAL